MQLTEELPQVSYGDLVERWEHLVVALITKDNFIHEFLLSMQKIANVPIGTMGVEVVDGSFRLHYNPYFVEKLTDESACWVIYHEVLHLAFHHCTLRLPSDPAYQQLANWAADLAINQLIPNTHMIKQPDPKVIKPLFPQMFGFPEKLSYEQYYQLLDENKDKYQKDNNPGEGQGDPQNGQGDPQDDQNGQGDPQDGQDPGSNPGQEEGPYEAPKGGQCLDNHSQWSEDSLADQALRQKIDEIMEKNCWGSVTGDIQAQIMAAQKAKVKWYKLLREYWGNLVSKIRVNTFKRPDRRLGYPYPGTTHKHVEKVLFCEDTSASVADRHLAQFTTEMNSAKRHLPIDHVQFDTQITHGPLPWRKRVKTREIHGRGGTNFAQVFELAEKKRYKSMVILTDGEADPPPQPKYVKDVIWCIVGGGKPPVDWGRVIHIK